MIVPTTRTTYSPPVTITSCSAATTSCSSSAVARYGVALCRCSGGPCFDAFATADPPRIPAELGAANPVCGKQCTPSANTAIGAREALEHGAQIGASDVLEVEPQPPR